MIRGEEDFCKQIFGLNSFVYSVFNSNSAASRFWRGGGAGAAAAAAAAAAEAAAAANFSLSKDLDE